MVERVCPYRLRDRIDDIVQNGVMAVLRLIRNCEADGKPFPSYIMKGAYIRTVSHNAVTDEIRRLHSRPDEGSKEGESVMPASPAPADPIQSKEFRDVIRQCLRHMVEPRRIAVALKLRGHNVPEISRLKGWTRSRVSNLVYRGLGNLRDCLRKMGWTP